MKTIQSVMAQMTDVNTIMQDVRETLREIDPAYPSEEEKYILASRRLEEALGNTVSPSASEFLAALEQEFVFGVIYVGWLGFKLRHDCHYNPINALLLNQDYEDILQERRLHTLSMSQKSLCTITAFYKNATVQENEEVDIIISYYAHLYTVGYKLAHFFGFRLAEDLLYYFVPGYSGDSVLSARYAAELKRYLNIDVESI